jgi:excisionase family DNA binding protein
MKNEDHPLLTILEAAKALRLSKNTLNNWLSQGKLKRVKIGRKTFVSRKEVNQLLEDALKL